MADDQSRDLEVSLLQWHIRDLQRKLQSSDKLPVMLAYVGGLGALPTRAHPGDAGFDLYTSEDTHIEPGQFVDVPCDLRIQLPVTMWALVVGRSSTLRKRGLLVPQGVIDSGYRGPIYAGCWNLGHQTVVVALGERIAQLIPLPLTAATLALRSVDQLDELNPGDRGEAGFGSSGL